MEVPTCVARAALFGDATISPLGRPVCEVITAAKRDLEPGELLDGIGGFTSYGLLENSQHTWTEGLLPLGLSEGCRLRRKLDKDSVVTLDDVVFPDGRLCDRLWNEQKEFFALAQESERTDREEISGEGASA
jgi:predicted homoserine dehydrogenase-like protein